MNYEIEELVPIVARLAECYTSKESTSISYDKAQQLMEAVIYCIHECELTQYPAMVSADGISAQQMYEMGRQLVEEKVKQTLDLYNEIMTDFSNYENECLYDTIVKGMPEFFKWYDCKFNPQDTILTLDYPVLFDVSQHTGIDRIYDYLLCIKWEQQFLKKFPPEMVLSILSGYDKSYKRMIDNLCEIVVLSVSLSILSGKGLENIDFMSEEYQHMQEVIQKESLPELRDKLKKVIGVLVREHYDNDENMMEYLYKAIDNISVRIKAATEYNKVIEK